MYKVFLVDDEIAARECIRNAINWDETDFIFCGEAPDGEIALSMLEELKPDILIADICMPFMNGLELSREVRKRMPWIKILILSGHDEFKYAREAIGIGVTDYLLKPIKSVELLKVLSTVAKDIKSSQEKEKQDEELILIAKNNRELLKEKFFSKLSLGMVSKDEIESMSSTLEISLDAKYFLAVVVSYDFSQKGTASKSVIDFSRLDSSISSISQKNKDVLSFSRNLEEFVLIFKGDNGRKLETCAREACESVSRMLGEAGMHNIYFYIGGVQEGIGGIPRSLTEADSLLKNYKYFFEKNKIVTINDIKSSTINKEKLLKLDSRHVLDYIRYGERSGIPLFLHNYMQNIDEAGLKSSVFAHYVFMDTILTLSKFINERGAKIESVIPEIKELEFFALKIDSADELKNCLEKVLNSIFDFRDGSRDSTHYHLISKVKEYIDSSFADPDFSLNDAASYARLSPSHFSTVFRQETGDTFIEYLTKARINKAMELLKTTGLRSADIAYKVGYNDPHYFSYMFKKITGSSPTEFRNKDVKK